MTLNNRKSIVARRAAQAKAGARLTPLASRKAEASAKGPFVKKANQAKAFDTTKATELAKRIAAKMIERQEATLAETEQLVKDNFPARTVSASLTSLRRMLRDEGIHAKFDTKITRSALRKTASEKVTDAQRVEALKEITAAVVDETNENLEACDQTIQKMAEKHFKMKRVAARRMRSLVKKTLVERGLDFDW